MMGGERKVLNKYYPQDFDPSKLPRARRPKNQQMKVGVYVTRHAEIISIKAPSSIPAKKMLSARHLRESECIGFISNAPIALLR